MSKDHSHPMERHCDVAVIGGSAAGLAAALQLARQVRSVIVVDSGEPRNAPASHMHSYLGHEGVPPADFAAIGREEVRSYGVEVLGTRADRIRRSDVGRFRVELESGHAVVARKVLAATGLIDVLPPIEGLSEHWGRDVIHCPFCHGFEVRDRRLVYLVSHEADLHTVRLFRQLTDRLTLIVGPEIDPEASDVDLLRTSGAKVVEGTAIRVVEGDEGQVVAVELSDGNEIETDAVVVRARFAARAETFADVGLRPIEHPSGLGDFIEVDETGETSIPGLYAAGNVADPSQQVLAAAAAGSFTGAMIAFRLAEEDLESASSSSAGESEWDHRYSGERMWSGRPNPTLVTEASGLSAGRALDVGAGEGGDALWLAEQGWAVTATDISARALEVVAEEGAERGFELSTLRADINDIDPFQADAFDLVSAHFLPIHRTPDRRGIRNILDAVAPGGTLLVVSHDPTSMRGDHKHGHRSMFDSDAYAHPAEFADELGEREGWEVLIHENRPRPTNASGPHPDDVVLLARRETK